MPKKVKLKDVTADNWEQVVDLEVSDDQEDFVADNAYSLAESKFDPHVRPRAIYASKRVVGFLMYETLAGDGKPHDYSIYRLMIDKRHQGKGYGRQALERAIEEIQEDKKLRRITICYVPGNPVSKAFYGSLGFREVGLDEDGEMVAELVGLEKSDVKPRRK
jgi:diamine N-acetyltransferase